MNLAFKALVGSHNYNLNNENSDKDYKVFYYPAFGDMYSGDKSSKHKTSTEEDIEYHDIRKLPNMLWKSNVNFIEVLFSQEIENLDGVFTELNAMRESIAAMNLPYLWDACTGMMYQKLKHANRDMNYIDIKDNPETIDKKVGKSLYQVARIHMFLNDYADTDFTDFAQSIYVSDDEGRNHLLNIKSGINTAREYKYLKGILDYLHTSELKEKYISRGKDEETKNKIEGIVKRYVTREIAAELNQNHRV